MHHIRKAFAATAITGALVFGGAVAAHAATSTTTKSPTTSSSSSSSSGARVLVGDWATGKVYVISRA